MGDRKNNVLYIFDEGKFTDQYLEYAKYATVFYPLKTNSHRYIIKDLIDLDSSFEVDSIRHIVMLIKEYHVEPRKILFSNVNKSSNEIREAFECGVETFTIDTINEFNYIEKLRKDYHSNSPVKYIIRINLSDFFSNLDISVLRFGTTLDLLKQISAMIDPSQVTLGVSFYVPKSIAKITGNASHVDNVSLVIQLIAEYLRMNHISLNILDIGGGISLDDLSDQKLQGTIERFKSEFNAQTFIEPGTGLVGNCFDLESQIKDIANRNVYMESLNTIQTVTIINMAIGIYSGLLDSKLLGKSYDFSLKLADGDLVELEPFIGTLKPGYKIIYLCGSTADPIDEFGYYQIPEDILIDVDKKIVVKNVGAYSREFSTNFIGGPNINDQINNVQERYAYRRQKL